MCDALGVTGSTVAAEAEQRLAALMGSTDEDFGYPADMGEEPQD